MRIALAHDYLNQWGGAELVLLTLSGMHPEAPIYTLLYDNKRTLEKFAPARVHASFLDHPYVRRNHRPFIPLMPLAARARRIPDEYDVVISSSAGFAKGMRVGPRAKHIAYIHTPLRYAWEQEEYLSGLMMNSTLLIAKPFLRWLKRWDYKMAQRPDVLIANSQFIAEKIKKYYGRDARVVYPPVDLKTFYPNPASQVLTHKSYFLAVGRLLHYKKFDLIIEAFAKMKLPLVVVGTGPEEEKLKRTVKNADIRFLPFVQDVNALRLLYQNARALVFPQVEDFGLVAAEAVACGTPVVAYSAGGAKEIVGTSAGVLFDKQTPEGLMRGIGEFIVREKTFSPAIVAKEAQKFSKEKFIKEMRRMCGA